MTSSIYIDDIANELNIDWELIEASFAKYGVNGSELDRSNGIWFETHEDMLFNDRISRIHNLYDENSYDNEMSAEDAGIQIGSWNAEISNK